MSLADRNAIKENMLQKLYTSDNWEDLWEVAKDLETLTDKCRYYPWQGDNIEDLKQKLKLEYNKHPGEVIVPLPYPLPKSVIYKDINSYLKQNYPILRQYDFKRNQVLKALEQVVSKELDTQSITYFIEDLEVNKPYEGILVSKFPVMIDIFTGEYLTCPFSSIKNLNVGDKVSLLITKDFTVEVV